MMIGNYQTKTTFFADFSIAENFGIKAVKSTFVRAFQEWKSNYVYVTELCVIMNLKCWNHYEKGNTEISELYSELYYLVRDYAYDTFKGTALEYFHQTID